MSAPAVQSPETTTRNRERKALIGAGVIGTAVLGLAMSGTLSALTASITNDTNTGGVGSLVMTEASGSVSCTTTATQTSQTCSTINKYGGSTTMTTTGADSSKTTAITITNNGTLAASTFTLEPGTCTLTNPDQASGDLCALAKVTIVQDGTTVVSGVAPSALASSYTLAPVAAGATSNISITFSTADLDNSVIGESVSQPLTWTFNA